MNLSWGLVWVFVFAILLAPFARADVCHKGGGRMRIEVRPSSTGLQFFACFPEEKRCEHLGPTNKGFTYAEFAKKRDELDNIAVSKKAVDVGGGLLTVFLLPIGGGGGAAAEAAKESNEARAASKEAKLDMATIAPRMLSTARACNDVESLGEYRERLERILREIDDARGKAKPPIAKAKLEDKHDIKVVPGSPQPETPNGSPEPQKTDAQ